MGKVHTVKRANVVLQVDDKELEKFLAEGFDEIDEQGAVIKAAESEPSVKELQAELKKALSERDQLAQELSEIKATAAAAQESDEAHVEEPAPQAKKDDKKSK